MDANETLIFPIGRMNIPDTFSEKELKDALQEIEVLPRILDYCVENLDAEQLSIPYREGGWTINQIIHHIADSHMNAFVRMKLTLTEDKPTIKPYNQDAWALTAEIEKVPVNYSITMVHALHHRMVVLLRSLSQEQMLRTYYHPEYDKSVPLWQAVHTYAWHGRHHAEQIRQMRLRNDW